MTGDRPGLTGGTLSFPRVGLRSDIEIKDRPHSWPLSAPDGNVLAAGKLGQLGAGLASWYV